MKRVILTLTMSVIFVSNMLALPFSEARREAWFLTDKMAYELNLSNQQYDHVYQVNLEYFLNVNSPGDCHGRYWDYRNDDLYYILHDWQYALYKVASYFYTPIRWIRSTCYHAIYDYYRKDYHYFAKPKCYATYRGGVWHQRKSHAPSPYKHQTFRNGTGMRDNYHKGNAIEHNTPAKPRPNMAQTGGRKEQKNKVDKQHNNRPSTSRPASVNKQPRQSSTPSRATQSKSPSKERQGRSFGR